MKCSIHLCCITGMSILTSICFKLPLNSNTHTLTGLLSKHVLKHNQLINSHYTATSFVVIITQHISLLEVVPEQMTLVIVMVNLSVRGCYICTKNHKDGISNHQNSIIVNLNVCGTSSLYIDVYYSYSPLAPALPTSCSEIFGISGFRTVACTCPN